MLNQSLPDKKKKPTFEGRVDFFAVHPSVCMYVSVPETARSSMSLAKEKSDSVGD